MADPVGLVSLSLSGVGKATSAIRLRRKHRKVIKALAGHAEAADLKLRNAGVNVQSYRAVLSPILDEATVLLNRFAAKSPLQALSDAMDDGMEDIDAAKKLIDAFKAADAAIELNINLLRVHSGVRAGNEATLARILSLQRDMACLEKTFHRCMLSVFFFRGGEAGVTPHEAQKL